MRASFKFLIDGLRKYQEPKQPFKTRLLSRLAAATLYFVVATFLFEIFRLEVLTTDGSALKLAGAVLGGLLSINLNTGYGRWLRSAELLGSLKSACLGIAGIGGINNEMDRAWKGKFFAYAAVFPIALRGQLRQDRTAEHFKKFLSNEDALELEQAKDKPLWLNSKFSLMGQEALTQKKIGGDVFGSMDGYRDELIKTSSGIIGISLWPIPEGLRKMSMGLVLLYTLALPWTAAMHFGWYGPVICLAVSTVLFSLEMVGMDLARPFRGGSLGAVPLNAFCDYVSSEVVEYWNETLGSGQVPDEVELPGDYGWINRPSAFH